MGWKSFIPTNIKDGVKLIFNIKAKSDSKSKHSNPYEILNLFPRFTPTETVLFDKKIKIVDSASFLFIFNEIFKKEIYKFRALNESPYIIDAGANIGLASIYFKKLFPNSEIVAFEPDSTIFETLEFNIQSFEFNNITLVKKALWKEETELTFYHEGADGGRIDNSIKTNKTTVKTAILLKYLNKPVDFLKIDIEGAEFEVLSSSFNQLTNVHNIFVEYHSFAGKNQQLPELLQLLKNSGFRLYVSSPGLESPQPLLNIKTYEGMDMQLNIYGFRDENTTH
ncbi:FkbM family methyltransferase [Flammeovirgaceae bacterium SG7u.111]|nr:FkbM family methyltransferase [Flammeovirgaceae bacterium SG7u.132]WPO34971.1 FkbM family methyltransferase [Flammeovirgaceae bacterium SG7u.111]